jgi:hypothetical protein
VRQRQGSRRRGRREHAGHRQGVRSGSTCKGRCTPAPTPWPPYLCGAAEGNRVDVALLQQRCLASAALWPGQSRGCQVCGHAHRLRACRCQGSEEARHDKRLHQATCVCVCVACVRTRVWVYTCGAPLMRAPRMQRLYACRRCACTTCHVRHRAQHARPLRLAPGRKLSHEPRRAGFSRRHVHLTRAACGVVGTSKRSVSSSVAGPGRHARPSMRVGALVTTRHELSARSHTCGAASRCTHRQACVLQHLPICTQRTQLDAGC